MPLLTACACVNTCTRDEILAPDFCFVVAARANAQTDCEVKCDQDAEVALQISNALTQALLNFRMQTVLGVSLVLHAVMTYTRQVIVYFSHQVNVLKPVSVVGQQTEPTQQHSSAPGEATEPG